MERVTETKNSMLMKLKENSPVYQKRPRFHIYPQMPVRQIQHFLKQAARRLKPVTVQLHPSTYTKQTTEVSGTLSLSPHSSHVILTTKDEETVHLIQPKSIRHVRLS